MRRRALPGVLVLLAVLVGPGSQVSVLASSPDAGDGLSRFRNQSISWRDCADTSLAASGTECARITVPLDYSRPRGRTIEVTVSRIAAADPVRRRGILQTNPGGPAARGLGMPALLRTVMDPRVAAAYDVIGMDTRGLGESSPVDCGLTRGTWLLHAPGPDRADFDEAVRLSRDDARSCWEREAGTLPHLSTRNIARDIDIVRGVLGERRTSWFGHSYGAILGAVYAQMFPDRVDRMVLDSALAPVDYPLPMVRRQGPANERALDDFGTWAARRHSTYGLGTTPASVRTGVEALIKRAGGAPIRIDGHRITGHELPLLCYLTLVHASANPEFATMLRLLRDAADGEPVVPPPWLRGTLDLMFAGAGTDQARDYAAQLAMICADAAMPRDPEHYRRAVARARTSQPVFGAMTHAPFPCAFWKERPREAPTRIGNTVPALQLHATEDPRTTYAAGLRLHRALRASRLVTVPLRAHTLYANGSNDCVTDAVTTYLLHGTLPSRDTICPT
ncbi:alpha/beta hydrolase [Streptomyces sp. NPDC057638]|uniref:alpha/beta hydrolase n=1 Tax=Streptomyces sp. NPDC057638 TaxID=3346190 RepID=UPI0036768A77